MTLFLDAPRDLQGVQQPRIRSVPQYATTSGQEAIDLAVIAGVSLDGWQQLVTTDSLGESDVWKCPRCVYRTTPEDPEPCPIHYRAHLIHPWSAFAVGLLVSRQNGKGGVVEVRELAGLYIIREKLIIHSAHRWDTSQDAFHRLVDLILGSPELRKGVRGYRGPKIDPAGIIKSHGAEGVEMEWGSQIQFRTRTNGGGRGFSSDCLILDEAMIIPEPFTTTLFPTLSARSNPQIWYTGSAVDQTIHEHGIVFARIRERGLRGDDPSLAYFEWSVADDVKDVTPAMAADPEMWALANPALGIRISPEYIVNERREFASNMRGFAVERLGAGDWPRTDDASDIISQADWLALADPRSTIDGQVVFAFDVQPDRSHSTIAVAGRRSDGRFHVEIVDHDLGVAWLPARLAELKRKHRSHSPIFLDASGPASSLLTDLANLKVKVESVSAKDHAQACGIFYDSVVDAKDLRHLGTPELAAALNGAKRRNLGDAWGWDRKSSAIDISPLVAATLALYGARKLKKGSRVINPYELLAQADKADAGEAIPDSAPPPDAGPFVGSRWTVS